MIIPGMFPGGAAGVANLEHLAVAAQTQAVGGNITIPTVQAGDLLILQTFARDDNTTAVTFASIFGWTTIAQGAIGTGIMGSSLHYKIATAADSGAVITGGGVTGPAGTPGQRDLYKGLIVVRGEVPITGVTSGSVNSQHTTTDPSAQTVTISGALAPLIVIGSYTVSSGISVTISPRTFTIGGVASKDSEYEETLAAANCDAWLAWKSFSPADSLATSVVIDMADHGNNGLISCYLACT